MTFYAIGALGDDELEHVADAMQSIRGGRHAALYGDDEELDAEDLASARNQASRLLRGIHRLLTTSRPALADRLGAPPP